MRETETNGNVMRRATSCSGWTEPRRIPLKPDQGDGTDVMRKHGKLMSFLRTFFSHRPPRNQLKQSGIVKERVFGCDLGEHLLNSGHDVPLLLKSCTNIIEEYGIVHGIYRLSGITSNIQKLRLAFDEDRVPDLTEECYLQDIHSISSLLKMYFRELPNPLLTYQLYDKFAAAVRDEDNKLLRIHDVVQQLPPPHYRTTEYLMRHLARVAAFGPETEMHSKNLAIVWAPNLLRSKELEAGGGAAALQGVGIQAVVTECLICYCDIIFSDKMPSYSSLDSANEKRPRPKSLAISTPTRLLSLEEARERAFVGHLSNLAPKKFIEVGGGPKNLPSKYHTVIDLPGYKKKVNSSSKENKPSSGSKKSSSGTNAGSGGWKSIFSKPRGGSVKKTRKPSQDSVTLGPVQAKALTEEDVHNWKRHHLRSAKSAESLFSPSSTTPQSSPSCTSFNVGDSASGTAVVAGGLAGGQALGRKEGKGSRPLYHLSHKRSLSSDASTVLKSRQVNRDEMNLASPSLDTDEENSPKQFTREDSKRKALHRRIPSAPNTPRQDRKPPCPGRSSSVSRDELSGGGEDMDISLEDFIYPKSESRGDVNIDAAIKSRLLQVAERTRSAKSNEELASSPLKRSANTPPKGRKKAKAENQNFISSPQELSPKTSIPHANRRVHRSSSDVSGALDTSPYDNDDRESRMRKFYSRFHDYEEIVSLDDADMKGQGSSSATPGSQDTPGSMSVSSSGCNMQDVLDQIDSRLAMNAKLFPRHQPPSPSIKINSDAIETSQQQGLSNGSWETKETVFSSSVQTSTSNAAGSQFLGNRQELDLSLNLAAPVPAQAGSTERKLSPSCSVRQTEFPAGMNSSPRELIEQETMRKLLGLDNPPAGGGTRVSPSVPDNTGAVKSSGSNNSIKSGPSLSTRVVRRHAEFIPSASASGQDLDNLSDLLDSLEKQEPRARRRSSRKKGSPRGDGSHSSSSSSARPSPVCSQLQSPHISSPGHSHLQHQQYLLSHSQHLGSSSQNSVQSHNLPITTPQGLESQASVLTERDIQNRLLASGHIHAPGITKCLSVPSDIARSLENVTESQTDMLSSVTISELSTSMSSFSNGTVMTGADFGGMSSAHLPGNHLARRVPAHQRDSSDPRHRRSSSLDSLTDSDRLLTRTLRDINHQMDVAFRSEGSPSGFGGDASMSRHHRMAASDLELSTSPEVRMTPQVVPRGDRPLPQQQAQDDSQWISTESIGQFQVSDQSITPTQATMDEAFKLFTEKDPSPRGENAVRRKSKSSSDSDDCDDLPPPSSVSVVYQDNSDSFLDVNMMSSPAQSLPPPKMEEATESTQRDKLYSPLSENGRQDFPGASREGQPKAGLCTEKQTHPHHNDQIVVESPQVARASGVRTKTATSTTITEAAPKLHHHHQHHHYHHHQHHPSNHHHHQYAKRKPSEAMPNSNTEGRADVANMRINRSTSSSSTSSSEEFDEVASPEEDEGNAQEVVEQKMAGGGRRSLTLPLAQLGNSHLGPVSMASFNSSHAGDRMQADLSPQDSSTYAVIRRQHSPRSPSSGQWSPRGERSADFLSGNEGAGVNLNRSWELDRDASERMSSLCAAGLMSQRARLSRESSNSSLQHSVSPDSSLSHILSVGGAGPVRSPLATPSREVLPDIIQSTAPQTFESPLASEACPVRTTRENAGRDEEGGNDQRDTSRSNVPLQLALYHPDEFSVDIPPAAVSGPPPSPHHRLNLHQSPSLPQVHSAQHSAIAERKPTIRKSSTDDAINSVSSPSPSSSRRIPSHPAPQRTPQGISNSASADLQIVSGNIRIPTSMSMDSAAEYGPRYGRDRTAGAAGRYGAGQDPNPLSPVSFRSRAGSDSRAIRAAAHQLQMERYRANVRASDEQSQRDHVAMEVDNLCNRLVDRMTSPRSRRPPLGGCFTNYETANSPSMGAHQGCESATHMDTSPLQGGSQTPSSAIGERVIGRSSSSGVSAGMQDSSANEEAENVLNRSREILQYPVAVENDVSQTVGLTSGQATVSYSQAGEKRKDSLTASGSESGIAIRKTSFSKIPRPRQSVDLSAQKSPGSGCLRKPEISSGATSSFSASMTSSAHADFSPSSSSTSSSGTSISSSRQAIRSRRSSETPGVGKRSSHIRRSSDTKLVSDSPSASPSSTRPQPSPTPSSSSSSCFSRSSSGGSGRGRQTLEAKSQSQSSCNSSANSPSSRIPLSHRVPSPQSGDGSPSLGVSRQTSKTKSPTPKPRKSSFNAKADQTKGQNSSSESGSRGDSTPRLASRREASGRSGAVSGRAAGARKEAEIAACGPKKSVVLKPLQDDSGAKLVIETQPEMRKKVQTVHAKKVSQPTRQVAESVGESESRTEGRSKNRTSAGGSGQARPISQQQNSVTGGGNGTSVTFSSDTRIPPASPPPSPCSKKAPPPVAKRKFRYDSKSLPRKSKQSESQNCAGQAVIGSCEEPSTVVSPSATQADYAEMIGSRSSLDDSVLQLAAERQEDLFSPEELAEHHKHYGYSTGSLRAKRSVKLQSLLDLFEQKDSDSNVSDSSCGSPKLQPRERLHSGSSGVTPLTPCMEVKPDIDPFDVEDPHSSPVVSPESRLSQRQRSKSGEAALARTENSDPKREAKDHSQPAPVMMRSMPEPRGTSPRRRERGSGNNADSDKRLSAGDKLNPHSSQSRPPRYRSNSSTAAVGDMDGGMSPSQVRHPPSRQRKGDTARHSDTHTGVILRQQSSPAGDLMFDGSPANPLSSPSQRASVERRNSIKDLLQVFERQDSDAAGKGGNSAEVIHSPTSPSQRSQVRERLGSSSPPYHDPEQRLGPTSMRLSLEIPSASDVLLSSGPLSQPDVKSQPSLRLGPKPFYGAYK
ncbi:rho GTPase activating protein 32 [Plakobranchus ocellatus]|uniref:Rho GTPase activating protein 32 n=1 Tax=Plakobranchus ocellatus TaxID=259542 RepID=A0AAV4DSA0_9GAST|nr:rho GTPase activating protein 32 [Plakobranchus ocellatus]